METLVKLDNVVKLYRRDAEELRVLDNLTFEVKKGEFVALMGPSGSGKTTILNLMGGIDRATSGSVKVGPDELTRMSEAELTSWRSHHVGFIFQLYHLIPVLTALENVELPLLLYKMSRSERRERAQKALGIVSLSERMGHFPRQLSGGQEQRVAIARAIVSDPLLLLADEPTGDLDAKSAEEILVLLETLHTKLGKTIVMVTHDPKAAKRASRVVHLEKGVLEREEHQPRPAASA